MSERAAAPPTGDSVQGGVGDGMLGVAGERHCDGKACPPRHLLHSVDVLRAGGEEGHASCVRKREGTK